MGDSFGRRGNGLDSPLRRRSLRLSPADPPRLDDDTDDESVSEAGDIGDREYWSLSHSNRHGGSSRLSSSHNVPVTGAVFPVLEDDPFRRHDSPSPADASANAANQKQNEVQVHWLLIYVSSLLHLALFGQLGVLTRYSLGKLFGPGEIGATSDESYMYSDIFSNMVGSYLMGWLGVVFKADIAKFSGLLAVGLTTGYLGSLTTFSGWNQKMVELSVEGRWAFAVLASIFGLVLVYGFFSFGVDHAKLFKELLERIATSSNGNISSPKTRWKVENSRHHWAILGLLISLLGILYGLFGALEKREFGSGSSEAQLWLACMIGPFGVWIRWLLARLNGRGWGKAGSLKWVPFGTLIANIMAACVMAALATVKIAVKTKNCNTVTRGLQLGLMGCLSTVSTFIAEFAAMKESRQSWRAYAYAIITVAPSFILGTLIYSVPVWVKGYGHH